VGRPKMPTEIARSAGRSGGSSLRGISAAQMAEDAGFKLARALTQPALQVVAGRTRPFTQRNGAQPVAARGSANASARWRLRLEARLAALDGGTLFDPRHMSVCRTCDDNG
jgi:hypothetical protein